MDPEVNNRIQFQSSSKQQLQVGIQCFISPGPSIPAVTKFLLTDFIVNQISESGQLIKIKSKPNTKVALPEVVKEPVSYEISKYLFEEMSQILGGPAAQALSDLYKRVESGQKITQWQYIIEDMPDLSKQQRTKIHGFVRDKLVNIESNTLDGNKMKLKLNKKVRKINPASRNKYIHFTLYKSNIDTMGALFKLSKLTGINQKLFSSAGLKDKRGVTTQLISVYNSQLTSLQRFYNVAHKNKEMWIQGFKQNMQNDIGVGNLYGNQFGLILRLINPSDSELIQQRVNSIRENGMINYFGMQRFGSCGVKTHMIGKRVLKKQWKDVVQELLLEQARDESVNRLKRQCYENQQYGKGERELGNKYKIEKNIFKGLKKHGKNFQNVFESLPRTMKTLYLHSLQSYLWNRMVSRRLTQFGMKVQIGDLVGTKLSGFKLAKAEMVQEKMQEREKQKEEEQDIEQLVEQEVIQQKYEVKIIASEEQRLQYNISEVVFPLYGPNVYLPQESLAYKYLLNQLSHLNLTFEDFTENNKQLCFKGMYRKMVVIPPEISFKIISYQNCKDQLQSPFYLNGQEVEVKEGPRRAAQVSIQLPKSSYATMALRQILHIPSSFETQMKLNKIYEGNGGQKKEVKE